MPRIPVPDDYERDAVTVAGREDHHYDVADVNLDGVAHARNLTVREDDDGRYVGTNAPHAEAVADHLGVTLPAESGSESAAGDDAAAGAAADEDDGESAASDGEREGVCTATVERTGEECGRELPCPYHSPDDEED